MNHKTVTISNTPWSVMATKSLSTNPFFERSPPFAAVDLLAVSAHLFRRYRDDPVNRFSDLFHTAKYMVIEDQDHERAGEIASYYSEQIVLAQLRGDPISDWQRAVAKFINSDRLRLVSDGGGTGHGLVYRLPEYYENAVMMRRFFEEHFEEHKYIEMIGTQDTRQLRPLTKVSHNTRDEKVTQYWLKDIETGNPTMISVDSKNQLKYLWDTIFDRDEKVKIEGNFVNRTHVLGVNYTNSRNWRLAI